MSMAIGPWPTALRSTQCRSVKLDRTDWNTLYYFAGKDKNTEEIVLSVKKIEIC